MNSMKSRISARSGLFIAGALLMLTGAFVSTAHATGVKGELNGRGSGVEVSIGGEEVWAGQFRLTIDGDGNIYTYCIDFHTPMANGEPYEEANWDESNVANLGKITWVLAHGFPTVSPAALAAASGAGSLTEEQAAAATQSALWKLADDVGLDDTNDAAVLSAYDYLVNSAVPVVEPPATLHITPASLTGVVGERIGPFTVATTGGPVSLSSASGAITDADGNPLTTVGDGDTFYITVDAPGTVVIDAEATATLFLGRVFLGINENQQTLINIETGDTHTSVTVSVDVQDTTTSSSTTTSSTTTTSTTTSTTEPTTSSTEPETTAAQTTTTQVGSESPSTTTSLVGSQNPATTTTEVGSEGRTLPRTGSDSNGLLLVAFGLALIGSSLVLTARRARP